MKKHILCATMSVLAFSANSAFADVCEGLSNKAFGICNAATTPGNACDVDPSTNSCERLATRYEQLTGETPPWLAPQIQCPTTLNALPNWFESDEFSGVTEINMVATFTNATGVNMRYSNTTAPQVWSVPSVAIPPIVYTFTPNNVNIAPGATFVVDLMVDVSGLAETENKFAFRPRELNAFGTIAPDKIPLQSVSFSCN